MYAKVIAPKYNNEPFIIRVYRNNKLVRGTQQFFVSNKRIIQLITKRINKNLPIKLEPNTVDRSIKNKLIELGYTLI